MAAPTKKDYEEALERKSFLIDVIIREEKNRENLINKLCSSQENLKTYEKLFNDVKEIIQKYEIYQEILAENGQ